MDTANSPAQWKCHLWSGLNCLSHPTPSPPPLPPACSAPYTLAFPYSPHLLLFLPGRLFPQPSPQACLEVASSETSLSNTGALVSACCVTSHHKLSGFKEGTFFFKILVSVHQKPWLSGVPRSGSRKTGVTFSHPLGAQGLPQTPWLLAAVSFWLLKTWGPCFLAGCQWGAILSSWMSPPVPCHVALPTTWQCASSRSISSGYTFVND